LSLKSAPKITVFCDSLEPNKHWSKRLRFGEEFPAENPAYGVLPNELNSPIAVVNHRFNAGILAATFATH
jgi:hypothetical protein